MTELWHTKQKISAAQSEVALGTQTIISATKQVRKYPYNFAKHIHKSIEIYLIDSGRCAMEINDGVCKFQAGDFVMIHPNTVHSFYMEEDANCTFRHIHFNSALFSRWYLDQKEPHTLNLLTALILPYDCCTHLSADEKISSLIDSILTEHEKDSLLPTAMANLHMAELLLYLIMRIRPDLSFITDSLSHAPEHIQYVSYALSYIHENFAQKILIPDIAAHLNISSRYLSKVFFQHMNLTILNYINIYRINRAIDLMTDTDATLTSISVQIGLKDSQHFSRLFRNIIGLPPSQYRKLLLHDNLEDSSMEDLSV